MFLYFIGPTSFAPIIETAVGIVNESGGQYHVLLIIADGQVEANFRFLCLGLLFNSLLFSVFLLKTDSKYLMCTGR